MRDTRFRPRQSGTELPVPRDTGDHLRCLPELLETGSLASASVSLTAGSVRWRVRVEQVLAEGLG
jgi:hypothetical protein